MLGKNCEPEQSNCGAHHEDLVAVDQELVLVAVLCIVARVSPKVVDKVGGHNKPKEGV